MQTASAQKKKHMQFHREICCVNQKRNSSHAHWHHILRWLYKSCNLPHLHLLQLYFQPGVPAFTVPQPETALDVVANRAKEIKVPVKFLKFFLTPEQFSAVIIFIVITFSGTSSHHSSLRWLSRRFARYSHYLFYPLTFQFHDLRTNSLYCLP